MNARGRVPSILAVLLILGSASGIAAAGETFLSPYPVQETAAVVSRWLADSGAEAQRFPEEGGGVLLVGRKGEERWRIRLRPNSPLGARVDAEYSSPAGSAAGKEGLVRKAVEAYGRNDVPAPRGGSASPPPEILAARGAVVCIRARMTRGREIRFTGFAVEPDGLVLSTAHDIDSVREVTVVLPDGTEKGGRILLRDPERDLTLIEIGGRQTAAVSLARGRNLLEAGETVYGIGCPDRPPGAVRKGVVAAAMGTVGGRPLWIVDMETPPGSSGGPVFDARGNLAGVVKGRFRGTLAKGFVIPVETVLEFLKEGKAR